MPGHEVGHVAALNLRHMSEDLLNGPFPPDNPQQALSDLLVETPADVARGDPTDDLVGRYVFGNHRAGCNHRARADRDTAVHQRIAANPNVGANSDRPQCARLLRRTHACVTAKKVHTYRIHVMLATRHQDDGFMNGTEAPDPYGRVPSSMVNSHLRRTRKVNEHHWRLRLSDYGNTFGPAHHGLHQIRTKALVKPGGKHATRNLHQADISSGKDRSQTEV